MDAVLIKHAQKKHAWLFQKVLHVGIVRIVITALQYTGAKQRTFIVIFSRGVLLKLKTHKIPQTQNKRGRWKCTKLSKNTLKQTDMTVYIPKMSVLAVLMIFSVAVRVLHSAKLDIFYRQIILILIQIMII